MTRVVAAELLKLRTTRTFWGLALSALGLVLLIVVLNLALDDNLRSASDVRGLLSSAGIFGLLALVLGVVAGAGEYRHGTIASTAQPWLRIASTPRPCAGSRCIPVTTS